MRERLTARVVLLDPDGRILLMKGRLPGRPGGPAFWYTVGGGVEDGETLMQAAAREIDQEKRLFRQAYVVARTRGGEPSRDGWLPHEQRLTDDMRWWTLGELQLTEDVVYPIGLAVLLEDVL